ncbi:MAG: hypothetical protein NTY38_30325, partial [Acidobacteria bacterium]|nr:hypothetical protein [Acidobacteriota bacterium]
MIEIFLCHSPADRQVAATIAARLKRSTGLEPWVHVCGPGPEDMAPVVWDMGLSAAGILLLLSPEVVPRPLSRAAWQALLDHVGRFQPPPIGTVLVRDCPFPLMLKRKAFFEWGEGSNEVLRAIERWVIGLYGEMEERLFVPARLPRFAGREPELARLWEKLVDNCGTVVVTNPEPGSGKTSLAQQFASAANDHFRDVVWVECGDRSPAFIAGELAVKLGAKGRRVLVVLDDVREDAPILPAPEGLVSLIVTTRNVNLQIPGHVTVMPIEAVQPDAPGSWPSAEADEGRLWRAMSACRPNGLLLSLAAEVAGLSAEEARAACGRLVADGWVDPVDEGGKRFRLPAHSCGGYDRPHRQHAETLCAIFREHRDQPARCAEVASELEHSLGWAFGDDWSLATRLARYAFQFWLDQQRLREAVLIFERLRDAALERQDLEVARQCNRELSWLRNDGGEI